MADILVTTGVDSAGFRRGLRDMETSAAQSARRTSTAFAGVGKGLIGGIIGGNVIARGIHLATASMREFAKENESAQRIFAEWGSVQQGVMAEIGAGLFGLAGGGGGGPGGLEKWFTDGIDTLQDDFRKIIGNDGPGESAAELRKAEDTTSEQNKRMVAIRKTAEATKRAAEETANYRKELDKLHDRAKDRAYLEEIELHGSSKQVAAARIRASFDDEISALRASTRLDPAERNQQLLRMLEDRERLVSLSDRAFENADRLRAEQENESDLQRAAQLGDRIGGLQSGLASDLLNRPSRLGGSGNSSQFGGFFGVGGETWKEDIRKTREEISKTQSEQNGILRQIEQRISAWAGVAIAG